MDGLQAVILDWAGTTVDHGSLAPVRALTELFARRGIDVSDADARRDMGLYKQDHIRRILSIPSIETRWVRSAGKPPTEADVDTLFGEFIALQTEVLTDYSRLIFGIGRVAESLRARGLKIATTTGYTRPMLDVLLGSAAEQGFRPDLAVCPDDVGGGRPKPWMCMKIALDFRLNSVGAAVKIGDTPADILEGLNAGMWTVGVTTTGNEIGLSAEDFAALPESEREMRLAAAREVLENAGAHYVIESAALCEPVLEEIDARLAAGERP